MNLQPSDAPRGRALAEAAAKEVIPGGVNSATRYIGEPYAFTSAQAPISPTSTAAATSTTTRRSARSCSATTPRWSTRRWRRDRRCSTSSASGSPSSRSSWPSGRRRDPVCRADDRGDAAAARPTAQAVRLARAVTGRPLLVKFQGGFHGWHDAVARNVDLAPGARVRARPAVGAASSPEALDATLIAEFNDLDSVARCSTQHPDRIAAVILEPIPHNVGALLPDARVRAGTARA